MNNRVGAIATNKDGGPILIWGDRPPDDDDISGELIKVIEIPDGVEAGKEPWFLLGELSRTEIE